MQSDCGLRRERGNWSIENGVTEFRALPPLFWPPPRVFIQPRSPCYCTALKIWCIEVFSETPIILFSCYFPPLGRMQSRINVMNRKEIITAKCLGGNRDLMNLMLRNKSSPRWLSLLDHGTTISLRWCSTSSYCKIILTWLKIAIGCTDTFRNRTRTALKSSDCHMLVMKFYFYNILRTIFLSLLRWD